MKRSPILFLYLLLFVPFHSFANKGAENLIEVYGALPKVSMMVMAPSGNRFAFRAVRQDADMFIIWDHVNRKVIDNLGVKEINPDYAYFIDDNRLILVASDNTRLHGYRGRHDVSVAFSFNIKTGNIRQLLVPGKNIYDGQTELGNIVALSSDGNYAYMPAWKTSGRYSLMKTHLDKNTHPRVISKGNPDTIDYFMGPNDKVLAKERYNNKSNKHSIQVDVDGDWVEIFSEEVTYRNKAFVGLTADYAKLVFTATNRNTGQRAYYTMALKDGAIEGPLFNRSDKGVESVITDLNRVVHGVRYSGFLPSYEFFDAQLNQTLEKVLAQMPYNSFHIVDFSADWKKILFLIEGDGFAGIYVLYQNGKFETISSRYPQIKSEQVYQVNSVEIKARDGLKIPTLLTIPTVKEFKSLPAIMLPHGGPESYDKIEFNWMAQYFASQGYLVIQPQFRGSTGFGAEFTLKGRGEWGKAMQNDLTDTVKTLVKSGYVDPNRVCIVGASYGGYAALAGAAFTPDLYQCAVSINGVADVEKMVRKDKRKYGRHHWVVSYWKAVLANGEYADNHLEQISPINHVNAIDIPVLLLHGEHDQVVSVKQSEVMYEEMEDADKQVKFVELEDGDHHMSKGKNRLQALKEIDKFLTQHLK